jgi:hypothetical protein
MRRFESARGLLTAFLPAALLLAWSAIAATAATAFVAAPLLGHSPSALALSPTRPRTGRALLLGLLGYPLVYALGFAVLGEANLLTGTLLGLGHALIVALTLLRNGGSMLLRENATRLLLFVGYGAVLGFAFLVP